MQFSNFAQCHSGLEVKEEYELVISGRRSNRPSEMRKKTQDTMDVLPLVECSLPLCVMQTHTLCQIMRARSDRSVLQLQFYVVFRSM